MADSTARGYPFPEGTDVPNVPSDMEALATALDTDVASVESTADGAAAHVGEGFEDDPHGVKTAVDNATSGLASEEYVDSVASDPTTHEHDTPVVGVHPMIGGWITTPAVEIDTGDRAEGWITFSPAYLARASTLDRLAIEVTTAGSSGSLVRLGVYDDDRGRPGNLLVDAGTVDATSTGIKETTISTTAGPGRIWLAAVHEGGAGTRPQMRRNVASVDMFAAAASNALARQGMGGMMDTTSPIGSLPASPDINSRGPSIRVAARRGV